MKHRRSGLGSGAGGRRRPPHWNVLFNGTTAYIGCGSDPTLDNLFTAKTATLDFWAASAVPATEDQAYYIVSKVSAWHVYFYRHAGASYIEASIDSDTISGVAAVLNNAAPWRHYTLVYSDTGDRKPYFAIDGVWAAVYYTQTAATGTLLDDSAAAFQVDQTRDLPMEMSWLRVSTGARWTVGVNFTPPARCATPAVDGSTTELWGMEEGTGLAVAAAVAPGNNGTGVDITWDSCG